MVISGQNPIPYILKDLENWSVTDLALLIIYLNRGVAEEFYRRVLMAPPEDLEQNWADYKHLKMEIERSRNSLMVLEEHFDYRIKGPETTALRKALRRTPSCVFVSKDGTVSFVDPPEMKNTEFEK